MENERLRIPAGVVIAALALGLMAFIALLFAACTAYALFIMHSRIIPSIPSIRMAFGFGDACIAALAIVAAATIVGLFRLKIWARYAITLLGLLDTLVFGLMTAGILISRSCWQMASMPLPTNPHITIGDVLLWTACFYTALALIGVWWMVYFNVGPVRRVFAAANARLTP